MKRTGAVAIVTIAAVALLQGGATCLAAEAGPRPSPIAVVVDTSGSMNESDGSSSGRIKINGAKVALLDFLQQIEAETPIGLRAYPGAEGETGLGEEGCSAGEALVPIQPRQPTEMAATVRTLTADGDTPTAAALKAAAAELGKGGGGQATIVLVSDGESNCGQDPCDAAREIAASGVDLQTITVGFRISGAGAKELQCIADQTGGRYLSVHDNEGLSNAFDEISRPRIHLEVNYPRRVKAQVGNDPSGLVRIEATVSNPSQQQARGAVARIRFDVAAGAPAVIRPVVFLGNIEAGESRQLAWVFRPSVPPAERNPTRLPFTVIAGAENTLADAKFDATIAVEDAYGEAGDAGPILGDRPRIAILGDSYSAGEGADSYIAGTDTDTNPCHRSRHTYLVEAFGLDDERLLACSGAVTNDIPHAQDGRTVGSQLDQLARLGNRAGVEAVALTMGGNDAGFGKIVASCLFGRADCSRLIIPGAPFRQIHSEPIEDFVRPRIQSMFKSLEARLVEVNRAVNGADARASGGPVPILVLAYPLPTPLTPQACPAMLRLLSPAEIKYLVELGTRLNGAVEKAAESARDSGVPAFYVPNTEMAFQPDHTVCDRVPWARSLKSFNGAGVDHEALVAAVKGVSWKIGPLRVPNPVGTIRAQLRLSRAGLRRLMRGIQELAHPNRAGYAAETRALLRWSQSPDAIAAERFLASSPVAEPQQPITLEASPEQLGQLAPGVALDLQAGSSYALQLGGFAPDSSIEIGVESEFRVLSEAGSDNDGRLDVAVGIPPDLEPGEHVLVVRGVNRTGEPREVEIPFRISGDSPPAIQTALLATGAAGATATAVLALFLFAGERRRR